jgi:hypothetical protein
MNEYEFEPVPGLPESLPEGEQILWQGAPDWRSLAIHVFHARAAALYFALLIGAHLGAQLMAGAQLSAILAGAGWQLALSALTVGILTLMGYLYGRSSMYTLTNRRLVLRTGVAVPMMINLPLDQLAAADLRQYRDGSGDLALTPQPGVRLSYWALWPSVRPWHFSQVRPSLRCLAQPEAAARVLADAVGARSAGVLRAAPPPVAAPFPAAARDKAAAVS